MKISEVASSNLGKSGAAVPTGTERHSKIANGTQNGNGNGIKDTIQKKFDACVKKIFNKNKLGS